MIGKFSLHTDLAFYSICCIVILLCSVLLYAEYIEKAGGVRTEKAGMIIYKNNVAQRKFSSEVLWEDIGSASDVFIGDTVKTGDESSAIVALEDGTSVIMSRNSMIQFLVSDDLMKIDMMSGMLSVNRGNVDSKKLDNITITFEEKDIAIGNGDITIVENENDIDVFMGRGNARILSGKKEYMIDEKNSASMRKNVDEIVFAETDPRLRTPDWGQFFKTYSDSREVPFTWEAAGKTVFLAIANDKYFMINTDKKAVSGSAAVFPLRQGEYYWKVESFNDSGAQPRSSEVWPFTIVRDEPVELIHPFNGAEFFSSRKNMFIDFRWLSNPLALTYTVEISSNATFSKIVRSVHARETGITVDSLGAGTYFWRVKANSGFDYEAAVSYAVNSFRVVKTEAVKKIELFRPKDGSVLTADSPSQGSLIFSCRENADIDQFKFVISQNEKFESIIYSNVSSSNFFVLEKGLPEGSYYWKVEGVGGKIERSAASEARNFNFLSPGRLAVIAPWNNSIVFTRDKSPYSTVLFSWRGVGFEGKYQVRMFGDSKADAPFFEITTEGNSASAEEVPPGRYNWTVSYYDKNNEKVVETGPTALIVKEALGAPGIIAPLYDSVFNLFSQKEIVFAWEKITDADRYTLKIFRMQEDKEELIFEQDTEKQMLVLKDMKKFDKGYYRWTLQAFEVEKEGAAVIRKSGIVKGSFILSREVLGKPEIEEFEIQ